MCKNGWHQEVIKGEGKKMGEGYFVGAGRSEANVMDSVEKSHDRGRMKKEEEKSMPEKYRCH